MEENKQNTILEKLNKQVEEKINNIVTQGIKPENIENLYKLVDIHKDIANEQYWNVEKKGEDSMMYRYGRNDYREDYGARRRDSRGRYMEGGRYNESGRYSERGRDSKYRGHEMIDEMDEYYGNYMEEKEYGNYGGAETMKSLEYMLESVVDFIAMLKKEATNQEEINLIKKYTKKINEM